MHDLQAPSMPRARPCRSRSRPRRRYRGPRDAPCLRSTRGAPSRLTGSAIARASARAGRAVSLEPLERLEGLFQQLAHTRYQLRRLEWLRKEDRAQMQSVRTPFLIDTGEIEDGPLAMLR